MGKAAYLVTDIGAEADAVAAATESSPYVAANANNGILGSIYRADSTSAIDIEWDLGSAIAFDTFAIHGHNFTSAATVNLYGGASPSPATLIANIPWREESMYARFSEQSPAYVRLVVADSNPSPLQFGEAPFGMSVLLPRAVRYGGLRGRRREQIVHETERGVRYVRHQWRREVRDFAFRVIESDLEAFRTLDAAVEGMELPFTFIPDVSKSEVHYCRKEQDFEPKELDDRPEEAVLDYIIRISSEVVGLDVAS